MVDGLIRDVLAMVGGTAVEITDVTAPWGSSTRTQVVALADGERIVLQRGSRWRGMGKRLRLALLLPSRAPRIRWAELLAGEASGRRSFLVTRFASGVPGSELLGNDRDAATLATQMGRLVPAFASVPPTGLRLSSLWGSPQRLAVSAAGWLARSEAILGPSASAAVRRIVEVMPQRLGADRPIFAHGDFAPVNVILRDGAIVAVLDLERARLAHPHFDAAWWRLMVRFHHPDRWAVAGPAFFSSAGLDVGERVVEQLDLLAVLQCLEMVGSSRPRSRATRAGWAGRLRAVLNWR